MSRAFLVIAFALLLVTHLHQQRAAAVQTGLEYDLRYTVRVIPSQHIAKLQVQLGQGAELVRWIRFRIDPERHYDFSGDGEVVGGADFVEWRPAERGDSLRYTVRVDHLRDSASYDARLAPQWGLFRGDDLVPPARVDTEGLAESRAELRVIAPEGWKVVAPYAPIEGDRYQVVHAGRRFDRPTGWFALGQLGITRERVAGTRLTLAGPRGHGMRRHDMLALLRWTLPALRDVVGELPERLLVVGAGDPMWRGGLSGPASIYIHTDRPLIARDGTSPLLHELIHVVTRLRAGPGGDWIVEGLAELYSVELLLRSKSISRRRYKRILEKLEAKGRKVASLETDASRGAVTARAVSFLHRLDQEIRTASEDARSLDDLLVAVSSAGEPVTTRGFQLAAESLAGKQLGSLFSQAGLRIAERRGPTGGH